MRVRGGIKVGLKAKPRPSEKTKCNSKKIKTGINKLKQIQYEKKQAYASLKQVKFEIKKAEVKKLAPNEK